MDALAAARAAVDLAPDDPDSLAILADALVANGYADEAIPIIEQAIGADASPPDRYREIAGLSYLVAGQPAQAVWRSSSGRSCCHSESESNSASSA